MSAFTWVGVQQVDSLNRIAFVLASARRAARAFERTNEEHA